MIGPVPCTSGIAARVLKAQGVTADLIYIDGSHHHDDVVCDLRDYRPLLRRGGVLFGDDCEQFGVRTALVEELCDYWEQRGPHWLWKN
jgi:predicted O-methyltransferase YrrM